MISLPSPYLAAILIAALVAALVFHLSRMLGRQRLVHAAYAAAAVGLIYLLGAGAFGWDFNGQGALLWVYLALFALAAAVAARRRLALGAIGLPWVSALIQLGVVAYMFAPESFRKPPVTAALFLYFLFEALVWLRGREDEPATADDSDDRERPPLFPPQRRRGVAEVSVAVAGLAIAYLLVAGPRPSNIGPDSATAQQHEPEAEEAAVTEETATTEETPAAGETTTAEGTPAAGETPASGETPDTGETAAASDDKTAAPAAPDDSANAGNAANEKPETPPQVATSEASPPPAPAVAKDPGNYTAHAGDTFKSIAKRLYGTTKKWRALADANPELKVKRFRAGQLIKLPSPPTR
jgi:LysM repeat protein